MFKMHCYEGMDIHRAWCCCGAGCASVRQCDLQDMLLSVPRLKEFVGRNLLAKPNLLGMSLQLVLRLLAVLMQ